MRKVILLMSMLFFSSSLFSQSVFDKSISGATNDLAAELSQLNKKKLVVLYIKEITEAETIPGKYIGDIISNDFVNNPANFEVFNRANLPHIVEAKKLIAEGYIDVPKAKELGKILSVDVIIVGTYMVLEIINELELILQAFDSRTGAIIASKRNSIQLDSKAGAVFGINVAKDDLGKNTNRGFNNRPINSDENYNNPRTVGKDCETNNTGDYCFTNETSHQFRITVNPSGRMDYKYLTLEAGQTQCFYNLQVRVYNYEIQQLDNLPRPLSFDRRPVINRQGQISIEKCKSKTFVIK